jgi:EamA domain-containing membrane protein RarD
MKLIQKPNAACIDWSLLWCLFLSLLIESCDKEYMTYLNSHAGTLFVLTVTQTTICGNFWFYVYFYKKRISKTKRWKIKI